MCPFYSGSELYNENLGSREILIAASKLFIVIGEYLQERSRVIPCMPVSNISLKTYRIFLGQNYEGKHPWNLSLCDKTTQLTVQSPTRGLQLVPVSTALPSSQPAAPLPLRCQQRTFHFMLEDTIVMDCLLSVAFGLDIPLHPPLSSHPSTSSKSFFPLPLSQLRPLRRWLFLLFQLPSSYGFLPAIYSVDLGDGIGSNR